MHWLFPLGTVDGIWAHSDLIYWLLLILHLTGDYRWGQQSQLDWKIWFCYEFLIGDGFKFLKIVIICGFCPHTEPCVVEIPCDTFSNLNMSRWYKVSITCRGETYEINIATDTSISKKKIKSDSKKQTNTFSAVGFSTFWTAYQQDVEQKTDNAWLAFTVADSIVHQVTSTYIANNNNGYMMAMLL